MVSILLVGEDKPGTRAQQRLSALRRLGHVVEFVRSHPAGETYETVPRIATRLRHRLRMPADRAGVNRTLLERALTGAAPDVLWIDYCLTVRPRTYRRLRRRWPKTRFVWYAEDDMYQPHNGSVWLDGAVDLFDLWVTTKSYNATASEMPARGASRVMFVNNSYDPLLHRDGTPTPEERRLFGAEICFVGTFEGARANSIRLLAEAGFQVRVWGNGWSSFRGAAPGALIENRPVYGEDLVRVYRSSDINLAFLRKRNRDLQTCRTVEIVACGGFMLHERNDEVLGILEENRHAAFFGSDDELVAQCRHWLAHPAERRAIAAAGAAHLRGAGFTHGDRLTEILDAAMAI